MRLLNFLSLLIVSALASTGFSKYSVPKLFRPSISFDPAGSWQRLMNIPNIPLPPFNSGKGSADGSDGVVISDVISTERGINIFAGFTRDIDSISKRLDDSAENTTVLAPLNSEIQKLPRKPWEDPGDYQTLGQSAYEGSTGEDRAHKNLRRFVEAHILPASPWNEGEKVKSLVGEEIWWTSKDGQITIQPGGIEISSVANRVSNGEVWVLKGVMNYGQ